MINHSAKLKANTSLNNKYKWNNCLNTLNLISITLINQVQISNNLTNNNHIWEKLSISWITHLNLKKKNKKLSFLKAISINQDNLMAILLKIYTSPIKTEQLDGRLQQMFNTSISPKISPFFQIKYNAQSQN